MFRSDPGAKISTWLASRSSYKPLLLDLFCGAGGASTGYVRAGFNVIGVDVKPQPNYPFEFVQADALSLTYDELLSFDLIHASPPCQNYSTGSALARKRGKVYPDLVMPTRRMLVATGLPYIMENVRPAPLRPDICLDGSMFGLKVIRPRVFETNILGFPVRPAATQVNGRVIDGDYVTVAGNGGNGIKQKAVWGHAMGIDWMSRDELRESIPPAYTEWIGRQALLILEPGAVLRDATMSRYHDRLLEPIRESEKSNAPVQMRLI